MALFLRSALPARAFLLTENPENPVALPAGSVTRGLVVSQSSRCPSPALAQAAFQVDHAVLRDQHGLGHRADPATAAAAS